MSNQNHLVLVDASGFAYRAWAVQNPVYRPSDGRPIGAVLEFCKLMWRMRGAAEADQPTHGAAVFDAPGPTFRHEIFPAYKGDRPAARKAELEDQFTAMRGAALAMGLQPIEAPGYEADDVIATLATRAALMGWRTTVVSSDKDFAQLVVDDLVEIVDPMAKRRWREADVQKRWGVPPQHVPDVQALAGDPADGIPGIPGIGLKSAAAIVRAYGTVPELLRDPDRLPPRYKVPFRRHKKAAALFLRLTRLDMQAKLPLEPSGLHAFLLEPVERSALQRLLKTLEAEAKFGEIFEGEVGQARIAVPALKDPLRWWRDELECAGQQVPEIPQCGYYEMRLVRGGVPVGVHVWREPEVRLEDGAPTGRDLLCCTIAGDAHPPGERWGRFCANPVSKERYDFLMADSAWAKRYAPADPVANPKKRVDHMTAPVPTFKKKKVSKGKVTS